MTHERYAQMWLITVQWTQSGYRQVRSRLSYAVLDVWELIALCGFTDVADFSNHTANGRAALTGETDVRDDRLSEGIAVDS